jgi:hypothetical protein
VRCRGGEVVPSAVRGKGDLGAGADQAEQALSLQDQEIFPVKGQAVVTFVRFPVLHVDNPDPALLAVKILLIQWQVII